MKNRNGKHAASPISTAIMIGPKELKDDSIGVLRDTLIRPPPAPLIASPLAEFATSRFNQEDHLPRSLHLPAFDHLDRRLALRITSSPTIPRELEMKNSRATVRKSSIRFGPPHRGKFKRVARRGGRHPESVTQRARVVGVATILCYTRVCHPFGCAGVRNLFRDDISRFSSPFCHIILNGEKGFMHGY